MSGRITGVSARVFRRSGRGVSVTESWPLVRLSVSDLRRAGDALRDVSVAVDERGGRAGPTRARPADTQALAEDVVDRDDEPPQDRADRDPEGDDHADGVRGGRPG